MGAFNTHNITLVLSLALTLLCLSCSKDEGNDMATDDAEDPTEEPTSFTGEIAFIKNIGGNDNDDAVDVVRSSDNGFVFVGTTESVNGDIVDKTTDDADVWVLKTDAQGTVLWSKTYGGSSDEITTSIQNTADGGFILAAYTRSDDGDIASGNAGFNDLWMVKLSSTGAMMWEKTYGFSGNDQAFSVTPTGDGGYFLLGVLDVTASGGAGNAGRASGVHAGGDYWAIRTDASGTLLWSRYYGGSFTDTAYDAVEMDDGGFMIVGSSDSTDVDITENKGAYDFWVLRIDANGSFVWKKNFGGSEIDLGYAITKTGDGNVIIVGDTRSNDGNVSNLYGNADVWALKINPNGAIIWEQSYGGTQFESARDIVALPGGAYAIAASSRSNDVDVTNNYGVNDAWVFVIDEEGELQFQQTVGGSNLDFAGGLTVSADGALVLVGNTESADGNFAQNKGGKDAFIVKIK